jgi:hypothetical protein
LLNYSGLFHLNDGTIKNINVDGTNSVLQYYEGWIVDKNSDGLIIDCNVNGDIIDFSGGITGSEFNGSVYNCTFTGNILGSNSGGICGPGLQDDDKVIIENCCSNAKIYGTKAGGIFGATISDGHVNRCLFTGSIFGIGAGGIVGGDFMNGVIENCSSCSSLCSFASGGIVGSGFGYNGEAEIKGCVFSGPISGNGAGGITGGSTALYGNVIISECFSLGDMIGESSAGICGPLSSSYLVPIKEGDKFNNRCLQIKNCYSTGDLKGEHSGGIISLTFNNSLDDIITSDGCIIITDCYTTGETTNLTSGGILAGVHPSFMFPIDGIGIIKIENCVSNAPLYVNQVQLDQNVQVINSFTGLEFITCELYPEWDCKIWGIKNDSYPILKTFNCYLWEKYNAYNDEPKLIKKLSDINTWDFKNVGGLSTFLLFNILSNYS